MTEFIHDDFMLATDEAKKLYHDYAEDMPIIDYHCHLIPEEVSGNKRWGNLTQMWLYGDHYKWRAMRSNGVAEKYCTGDASDWEKFEKFAQTMPKLLRNPMYHWSQLELKRYFGVDELLSEKTAKSIYEKCNKIINGEDFCARELMKKSNVKMVCTTDDPNDSLEHHLSVAEDKSFGVKFLPTWRPDKGMAVDKLEKFNPWVDKLAETSGVEISDFDSFMLAFNKRQDFFHASGCRLSDHGTDKFYEADYTRGEVGKIFAKARANETLTNAEVEKFKSAMMHEFGLMNHARGWTQQFHYGVIRNNNPRLFKQVGADAGFDSIGDFSVAQSMSKYFGRLDENAKLARSIIYNINPTDNEVIATMIGNFQDGSIPGKMQFGSGWWFCDQLNGMKRQMEALSQLGLLSRFVGMLTDSRSFLSYTRHEYFRRLLCNILGSDMAGGLIPSDYDLVGNMVKDICYNNAARYFQIEGVEEI